MGLMENLSAALTNKSTDRDHEHHTGSMAHKYSNDALVVKKLEIIERELFGPATLAERNKNAANFKPPSLLKIAGIELDAV